MSLFTSNMIVSPQFQGRTGSSFHLSLVGRKALGLAVIPDAWRPPFVVLTSKAYGVWTKADQNFRNDFVGEIGREIKTVCDGWAGYWPRGIILRSSSTTESLRDRGTFDSRKLAADFNAETIATALVAIYSQFAEFGGDDDLAVIVQPLALTSAGGHLSNERRVSKTINHWTWECDFPQYQVGRLNSQRSQPPDEKKALQVEKEKELSARFRSIGRWCTLLNRGPLHIEWAWDQERLWLHQLDFEDESPDDGVDPNKLIRNIDTRPSNPLPSNSPFREAILDGQSTGWHKIDNVGEFQRIRDHSYPRLYFIDGEKLLPELEYPDRLAANIETVTHGRAICRTDSISNNIKEFNLPRTDSKTPQGIVTFMKTTLDNLIDQGAAANEVCFIIHKFIPAQAAAWTLANPESQIVIVDTLWGVPDGLQYLPHDSYEFDVKRGAISSERTRYKPIFIQETENGSWQEVRVARRYARHRSLSSRDVKDIAMQSHWIATNIGAPTQIMWFCGIPEVVGIGRNLPWYRMKSKSHAIQRRARISPGRSKVTIRSIADIERVRCAAGGKKVIVIAPDIELIREDNQFLGEIIELAKLKNLPVEFHGSMLGHAYYLLDRSGITIIPVDESGRSRVRGRRVFQKLVRDDIPTQIQEGGERVVQAKIPKSESRAALIVKLFEEAVELFAAESPEEVTVELADLLEVVRALCAATGVDWQDVTIAADKKRATRGSFERGVVLMQTSWPSLDEEAGATDGEISLDALARTIRTNNCLEVTFPTLFAKGKKAIVELKDGRQIRLSLTVNGLKIDEIDDDQLSENQLELDFPDTI